MDSFSLPSFYISAPTSPSSSSPQNLQFYSTRSSPFHQVFNQDQTRDDEFDFGTRKIFTNEWDKDEEKYRLPARANSFSTMAFADELFCNGQVLPLKLPPRLQRSAPTSPRSLSSRIKNPFLQQCTWNDDFDPFVIALEKVSEEKMSVHTREQVHEPQHTKPDKELEGKERKVILERKGSMYSRWVRSQTMIKNQSPTARTMISYFKRLSLSFKIINMRKKELIESKMAVVKHETKPPRCFGYGPWNSMMKRAPRIS